MDEGPVEVFAHWGPSAAAAAAAAWEQCGTFFFSFSVFLPSFLLFFFFCLGNSHACGIG